MSCEIWGHLNDFKLLYTSAGQEQFMWIETKADSFWKSLHAVHTVHVYVASWLSPFPCVYVLSILNILSSALHVLLVSLFIVCFIALLWLLSRSVSPFYLLLCWNAVSGEHRGHACIVICRYESRLAATSWPVTSGHIHAGVQISLYNLTILGITLLIRSCCLLLRVSPPPQPAPWSLLETIIYFIVLGKGQFIYLICVLSTTHLP